MLRFTKTTAFRIAAIVALLVGLYALAGFVLAPKLLRSALLKDIPQTLNVTPTVGEIHLNPFLFQLEVKDFLLASASGEKLVGFERLFVDFDLSSIWHRAYTFANIDIAAPYANAIVAPNGVLNLLQLRPKPSPPKPAEKSGPIPAIRIGSFKVSAGQVSYQDRSRPSAFAAHLEPINFELQNFSTGVNGGRFTFSGTSKLGERLEWRGHLSVQPIESDGEIQIDGLQAHTIWEYLEDQLNFGVNSGTVNLNATYQFSLKDKVDLKVNLPKVTVSGLAVRPKGSDTDWITVPELALNGTTVDLAQRQAHVDSLSLTGLKLVTWLEPDGSFNLLKLAQPPAMTRAPARVRAPASPPAPAGAPTPPTATTPATAANSGAVKLTTVAAPAAPAPWRFDLREFTLRDASISAEDRSTRPVVKVLLAPLALTVGGVSLDLAKPLNVTLDTRINEKGALKVSGDVTPQPLSANLSLKLSGIDLTVVQPYIAQHTSMTLLGGRLSGDAKLRYGAQKPGILFTGNISIAHLHTIDNALRDDFINWERLDVLGVKFEHDPDRLDIEQIVARKPYARVIIEPDSTLNVTRVLAGPGAVVVAPPAEVAHGKPARGRSTRAAASASASTPAVASTSTSAAASGPAAKPMPMAIKKIVLHGGQANFADLSVTPNFATGIQKLEGSVLGLSSKANSRAKVDLHGSVDAFSPVAITGEVNVLSAALYTDLSLSFRNMELSTFNPYSGKFAGYNITKGKLTTELHYKVVGRKLDAQHHITIDQLEFGAKTASKDAVSLPIKLAVALLKDRNGVIDLNIPVTGSLDDPKFRLGPIIWKVFVNLLEKAVTAPFALLGSLFGGGPNLQFIDFQPGAAQLDAAGADKIRAVVKALNQRPQLKIEVPIATISELDRPALVEAQFEAQIRSAQSAKAGGKKSTAAAPAFEQLEPAAKLKLLAQVYAEKVGGEPKFPEAVTGLKSKPEITAAKIDFLVQELHAHIAIGAADLTALAEQRAMAVQHDLLTDTQIDPARVFLVANDKAKKDGGKIQLELSLK